ncbi:hypothetical protein IFM89_005398 [Coptis chinensis]|uniref:RRM domain-containing protein n=1 Tax=Coptis chinensis TaxID=261450 RepID=A0A835M8R0_9MAGN|nr:hypothetical protein IFM89_005398 [Coptis chinensis]
MGRKRDKPYFSHAPSSSNFKKPRKNHSFSSFIPETPVIEEETKNPPQRQTTSMVLVHNLSNHCSVLNLKRMFEMYGCVSRIRIDSGVGYVNFRAKESADAAIAASVDPGIIVDDVKVNVSWANDSFPQWREGVALSIKERLSSKLVQPEVPLSRHGRGNKLGSGTVSPNKPDISYKGRDIVAYDDLF